MHFEAGQQYTSHLGSGKLEASPGQVSAGYHSYCTYISPRLVYWHGVLCTLDKRVYFVGLYNTVCILNFQKKIYGGRHVPANYIQYIGAVFTDYSM
jgi:hypothetical protein